MQNILIIEPSHDVRVLLRELLENSGFFVFSSGTGIDGLALLQRVRDVEVVLVETELPIMNVEQFLTIKQQDPELAKIPVVVMGSRDVRLERLGVKEFVSKPIDVSRLVTTLQKFGIKSPPLSKT